MVLYHCIEKEDKTMRLIFIRHPKTEANEKRLVYGRTDALYSTVGEATIPAIVEALHKIHIDEIYASPLTRTRLLAERIAGDHAVAKEDIRMDDRILEMNFGRFENMTIAQLEETYPEEYHAYLQDFNGYQVPEGESYHQLNQRVGDFLEEIYRRHEKEGTTEQTIVVVAHSMVIHAALSHLLHLDLNDVWHIKIEPGSLVDLDWRCDFAMLQQLTGSLNVREILQP